eukprot:COSAG02_NODE_1994_length_10160_cov_84.117483_6_plen_165_part_00
MASRYNGFMRQCTDSSFLFVVTTKSSLPVGRCAATPALVLTTAVDTPSHCCCATPRHRCGSQNQLFGTPYLELLLCRSGQSSRARPAHLQWRHHTHRDTALAAHRASPSAPPAYHRQATLVSNSTQGPESTGRVAKDTSSKFAKCSNFARWLLHVNPSTVTVEV